MKNVMPLVLVVLLAGSAWVRAEEKADAMGDKEKSGYAIGLNIGDSLKPIAEFVDLPSILKGMQDAVSDGPRKLTDTEVRATIMALQQKARAGQEKEGEAFLLANKTKEGVQTTASGLQYKVLKEGAGEKPAATDTVSVHYRGTLLNGTEFDSSYARKKPATFRLDGVIAGWTEGLQLMKAGSKYQFFIPANLAYGEQGSPPKIGPNAALIFEVELLEIVKK
jgi:FKBP-type peptidyl-prolyl cis-trans isomerase